MVQFSVAPHGCTYSSCHLYQSCRWPSYPLACTHWCSARSARTAGTPSWMRHRVPSDVCLCSTIVAFLVASPTPPLHHGWISDLGLVVTRQCHIHNLMSRLKRLCRGVHTMPTPLGSYFIRVSHCTPLHSSYGSFHTFLTTSGFHHGVLQECALVNLLGSPLLPIVLVFFLANGVILASFCWILSAWAVACSIKPKSQMRISYPPNLVHILILLGLAKINKFLAVPEVTANLTSCLVEKHKGFEKFIKGNFFRSVFHFLHI